MQNMLVFHNDADTSYANYAGNLSSMSSATTTVTLKFASVVASAVANDVVVLTVTAGEEENVMEAVAGAIAEARSGMTVIASDVSGKTVYIHPGITALASISVDNGAGTFKSVVAATFTTADTGLVDNRIIATNAHSGSVFTVNAGTDAASTVYLPASPITGWNARFLCNHPSDAHTITITENGTSTAFAGIANNGGDIDALTGTASVVIAASDYKLGDWFECRWDGTIWLFNGQFQTDASVSAS